LGFLIRLNLLLEVTAGVDEAGGGGGRTSEVVSTAKIQ